MHKARIPTLLGLLLVFGAVFLFSVVFEQVTPILSRASPSITPANVVISNVTDTTFSVSWTTPTAATGALAVEDATGAKYTAFDDRDQQLSPSSTQSPLGKYTTHMVTVRSGKPNSLYHMRIVSNGKVFSDGAKTYDVTTGPTLSSSGTTLEPAFGTITTPANLPAEGALVYLALEGSQTLSTFVKSSGSWVIPLHLARTEDYQSFITSNERIPESIIVRAADGDATAVTDTMNDNPVPAMTIGKSYDFRKIQATQPQPTQQLAQIIPTVTEAPPPAVLGTNIQTPSGVVALIAPKNGIALSANLPLIQGTGVPGNAVQLILGITRPQIGKTTVEADGVWRYTPTTPLAAGRQSVTMTTKDAQGKSKAITHTFEILKSGTQVLGDATPSATINPTPTATIAVAPTEEATLAGEPIPETGSPLPLILLLILGTGLLSTGFVVLRR